MNRFLAAPTAAIGGAVLAIATAGLIGTAPAQAQPTPAGPDKATATDLAAHPKLSLPAPDPAKWGAPRQGSDVIAMTVRPDGIRTVTYYTPMRGESGATLYRLLKSRGVQGLQAPAAASATSSGSASPALAAAGITSCRYGTAQLYLCATDSNVAHQVHWTNGCCTDPQIWFVDHTSSAWPVSASTTVWNQTPGIDSHYVYGSCPNYSGQHCIDITNANYGCTGWEGLTSVSYNTTTYNIVSASTKFNDYQGLCTVNGVTYDYFKDSNGYRKATCHELGHALGMGHNSSSTTSCLYEPNVNDSRLLQPNNDDFTLLSQLYSVAY